MIPLENFLYNDWGKTDIKPSARYLPNRKKYSKNYNDNNIFTFDTETTSIQLPNGDKCGFVYISMLCINGVVYYTRDLQTFKKFLDTYDRPGATNVIYIHNFSFDFSFLKSVIDFEFVFARMPHRPIFAKYKNWEFRCSYFLSQMSLANVGKSYNLPHAKLVDGLDYRKRRHTGTPLTGIEDDYCEIDVLLLHEYIEYMLKQNGGKYKNIPYTQTGLVRKMLLENAKKDKEYYKLRSIVEKTLPDIEIFTTLEKCFMGGYTHANFRAVASGLFTHVKSYDFTSSYPAVMCRCKFPMGKFVRVVRNFDKYLYSPEWCSIGRFRLTNIQAKCDLCYLSKHKLITGTVKNARVSNGRLYSADCVEIYLTNIDVQTVKMMYDCDIEVIELYAAGAGYLPKTIVKSILTLYGNKTQYKGISEMFDLYMYSKQCANSVYGCSVFNPYCDDIEYIDGDFVKVNAEPGKIEKYYSGRNVILPYQWGVFVTAHARQKLCEMCSVIGDDVLYMDTDSIKFVGDYDGLFVEYNKRVHAENIAAAEYFGFSIDMYAPKDKNGVSHELGLWDFEHEYKSFKVLGAKRYCYTLPGDAEIYPVVAGCPTAAMRTYLKLHNCNALLKPFRLDIVLSCAESGKNTIFYPDSKQEFDLPVTDYLGNTKIEHIRDGACIFKTTFDMSLDNDYLLFLTGYAVSDKKILIRNGVIA